MHSVSVPMWQTQSVGPLKLLTSVSSDKCITSELLAQHAHNDGKTTELWTQQANNYDITTEVNTDGTNEHVTLLTRKHSESANFYQG